jgi:hypothetical protein
MDFIAQLWLPIVVSAVLVFIASSLIHMVFKWHNSDYRKLSNEDEVRSVVRAGGPTPGMYMIPHCGDMKEMKNPEFIKKFVDGPVAFVTLKAPGPPTMGGALGMWFVYTLVIGAVAAYIAQKTLMPAGPEVHFLQVCRVVGALTFLAYGAGSVQAGIWMAKPWGSVAKDLLDAAIYAAVTALTFAWLWPH